MFFLEVVECCINLLTYSCLLRILIIMDTVEIAEFAAMLKIKPQSLRVRLSRRPNSLPKPVKRGRGSRVLWLRKDVVAWFSGSNDKEEK